MDENVDAKVVAAEKFVNTSEDAARGELIIYVNAETADAWTVAATRSGVAELDAVANQYGVESVKQVFNMSINTEAKRAQDLHRWFVVEFSEDADVEQVAQKFAELSFVNRVQFNTIIKKPEITAVPVSEAAVAATRAIEEPFNDTLLPMQWHYNNRGYKETIFAGAKEGEDIGVYGAWNYTTGNPEVIVAVVDEGVKYDHPDLAQNMWVNQAELSGTTGVDDDGNGYVDDIYGLNAVKGNGNITWDIQAWSGDEYVGDSGHGTHVAGTVAAVSNNGFGVAGVAGGNGTGNGVRIMSIQIFDGADDTSLSSNARGIEYAADNGACILQNSWGYNSTDGPKSDNAYSSGYMGAELTAMKYFQGKSNCSAMTGNVVIFAAGNDAQPSANYPGAYNDPWNSEAAEIPAKVPPCPPIPAGDIP